LKAVFAMGLEKYIEHTLLKPDATEEQIIKLCSEAKQYRFAAVCVNSCHAALATEELCQSGVGLSVVVGFPLGAMSSKAKAFEAAFAVEEGATEIDMVMNIGFAKAGDWAFVKKDIEAVVLAARVPVKVIIETCLLTDGEKVLACEAAKGVGAMFVKTSTGFSSAGATTYDIALMRSVVGPRFGVKASGGIRSACDAMAMIKAGADRLGTSAGVDIVKQA
jgi:deoxyribose-phosphate aldolase